MAEQSLESLLKESAECVALSRAELDALRPGLLRLKAVYVAHIEAIERSQGDLFSWAPAIIKGDFAILPTAVEKKCSLAVLRILKKELTMVNKAIGTKGN